MIKKRIVLIVNPKAGKCYGLKQLGNIVQAVQEKRNPPTVFLTRAVGDALHYVQNNCDNDIEEVLCVGGDGTLSEVSAGMFFQSHCLPIGYIPTGSTNDYAASLGLSRSVSIATIDAIDGFPQPFDIGTLNKQPFIYVAAFGAFAKVAYSTPQILKNTLGYFAYILKGICSIHKCHPESVSIDTDSEHIEGKFFLGTISNSLSIGGFLHFSQDDVSLNDGYLEMLLFSKPKNIRELAQIYHAWRTRSYLHCNCIIYRKVKQIHLKSPNNIPWTVDGECMNENNCVDIKVVPNGIYVMIPSKSG